MSLGEGDPSLNSHMLPFTELDSGFDTAELQSDIQGQQQQSALLADDRATGVSDVMPQATALRMFYFSDDNSVNCDGDKMRCDIHQNIFGGSDRLNSNRLAYCARDVGWSLVLTDVANRFMRNTLLFNAFPDWDIDLPEAALSLAAARDAIMLRGYHLGQRLSPALCSLRNQLLTYTFHGPEILLNRDMAILVGLKIFRSTEESINEFGLVHRYFDSMLH